VSDGIRVICGPTAAGKTAAALHLASRYPITIISADSRQIYRRFDIGTAKPTSTELASVPHVGVNVADPLDRWSAWEWAALARTAIADATAAGRTPVVVGGTGFYLRALTEPLASLPPLDEARRDRLNDWLEEQPRELWRAWCERLDPDRASLGPVQWRRAIETALLSGVRLSTLHEGGADAPGLRVRYLLVDPGPPLAERIAQRVLAMLEEGWVEEVEQLRHDVPEEARAWLATGYGEVLAHVEGRMSKAEMITRVTIRTRQYAKRQRTWFRHQLDQASVTKLSPSEHDFMDQANAWWQAHDEEMV
jgi:tRNA dimethylallyltransferase